MKMKRKRSCITYWLMLLLFLPSTAYAMVIDFEDVSPGKLYDGYKSLHWSNVSVEASPGLLSGNVAYGRNISIYSGPFEYFNLISMDVASETTNSLWIKAYTFSDTVFLEEVGLDELEETFLDLNLTRITRFDIWSDDNSTFLIDNLKITWLCGTCTDCESPGDNGGQTGGTYTPPPHIGPPVVPPTVNPPKIILPKCPPPEPPGGTVPPNCPPPLQPPPAPVPEPSTWILLGSGLALMARLKKRSQGS